MTGRLRRFAPLADLTCIVAFVMIGRGRHDIDDGIGWFLGVIWPLALGWFVVAIAARLYTSATRPWLRLLVTWGLGVTLALLLRGIALGRQPVSTFALVLYGFMALETFGWRAIALLFRRVVPARA